MSKYEYIDSQRNDASNTNPVVKMCLWLAVSTSGFYNWLSRPQSATAARPADLAVWIRSFFEKSDGTYGYRRIHADLACEGIECSPELVRQIMRQEALIPCQPRPFRITTQADEDAAATTWIEPDAIFHSDRGSVYTSAAYRTLVNRLGMRSSMGRTGVCWDNSLAESFFSALKNERVYRTIYATKKQARRDIIAYIEGFYNSRRRHSALNYQYPNDVHYSYQQPALAA